MIKNRIHTARSCAGSLWLCLLALIGCASSGSSTEPSATEPSSSGAEVAAPLGKRAGPPDVTGEWVEFWALTADAGADSQRYVFAPDGHFEWHAAASAKEPMIARFGTFTASGMFLDVSVKLEQPQAGAAKCADGCRTAVEPARFEQIALSECPPNEEAKSIDARYRCLSFNDRPFWHR